MIWQFAFFVIGGITVKISVRRMGGVRITAGG